MGIRSLPILARFIREGQLSEEFLYERDNGRIVEEFG